jgi:hypothetical protein
MRLRRSWIPAVEKKFRGIGEGWARSMYGGSTGGWESLAVQIFYPEHYNGAFVACRDPVDFHAFMTRDLYSDENMFYLQGANKRAEQPAMRDYLGHTLISMRDNIAYEAAFGDHGRSGSSSISGRRCIRQRGRMGIRSRSSIRLPGRLIIRSLRTGRSITISMRSCSGTEGRWDRSCKGRFICMWGTSILTF